MSDRIQNTIEDTGDKELNAIQFLKLAVRDLEPEAQWRVWNYAEKKIRANTYSSEYVQMAGVSHS